MTTLYRALATGLSACTLTAGLSTAVAAAETRGYVVNMFLVATSYDKTASCPEGLNSLSDEFFKDELRRLGHKPAEVEHLMKDFPNGDYIPITTMRGRIDGKPVNIYRNPLAQPDPKLKTVKGGKAYGFNLDGQVSRDDFVDPDTGEKGVDNQLWRSVGCIQNFAAVPPDKPIYSYGQWDLTRDVARAWLIEISGIDNIENDDDVTVTFERATDAIERDASGEALWDRSFLVDPDGNSHKVVKASIKNRVLTTEVHDLSMIPDYKVMSGFNFKQARVRLTLQENGAAVGFVGGYLDWQQMYSTWAQPGWVAEHATGINFPGLYYNLRKFADAQPDPATKQNQLISSTYSIEAFPAVIVRDAQAFAAREKAAPAKTAAVRFPSFTNLATPAGVTLLPGKEGLSYATPLGKPLYTYAKDSPNTSTCTEACGATWQPAVVPAGAQAEGDWSIVARADGKQQWAVRGKPLYTHTGDKAPEDSHWKQAIFNPAEGIRLEGTIKVAELVDAPGWTLITDREQTIYVRATSAPIAPRPRMPSVLPVSGWATMCVHFTLFWLAAAAA